MHDSQNNLKVRGHFKFDQKFLDATDFKKQMLEDNDKPIAQGEAAAVLVGLVEEITKIVGRDVVWFVDNTSALHAFQRRFS